jgi:hypothetical protein
MVVTGVAGLGQPTVDPSEDKRAQLKDTAYAITALAAAFVVLRFVARKKRGAGFGLDDYMLLVSLVVAS